MVLWFVGSVDPWLFNHISIQLVSVQSSPKMDAEIPNAIILSLGPWSHAFGCFALIGLPLLLKQLIFLPKFVDTDFLTAIQVQ